MATHTLEVPAELVERAVAADPMHRPVEVIAEEALADWVAREQWKHEATLEGLADIDAGRVVSHDRVVEWLESLDTDHPLPMPEPLAYVRA